MLFVPKRNTLEAESYSTKHKFPESFFKELDYKRRRKILDKHLSEDEDKTLVKQLDELFNCRYFLMKNGEYGDNFLRYWMDLRLVSESLDQMFSKKKNLKIAKKALENLQLGENSKFSEEIIYNEMCNLAAGYITMCSRDVNYTAIIWGLGKINDAKIKQKITKDLEKIVIETPSRLDLGQEFRVLKAAVLDTRAEFIQDSALTEAETDENYDDLESDE